MFRKRDDGAGRAARGASTSRCSRRSRGAAERRGLGVRDQVGRLPRSLATSRSGEAELRKRKDKDLHRPLRERRQGAREGAQNTGLRASTERSARSTSEGRPSFSAMQQSKAGTTIVYYVFDLLEVEGESLVDLPLSERRDACRSCSTAATGGPALRVIRGRQRRCTSGGGATARGDHRQAAGLALPAGQALARLAQVQDARRAGVRDRGLHARQGSPRMVLRVARGRVNGGDGLE